MATVSRATVERKITATLTLAGPEVSGQQLTPTALNPSTRTFTSSTSPPATQLYAETITLSSSGAGQSTTIDLTSWTDTEGISKDSTGLRVQEIRAIADSGNTADMTISGGDSDPYELFGSGNSVDVPPDGELMMYFADQLADVGTTSGTTATDIKISGTGGDSMTLEMLIG